MGSLQYTSNLKIVYCLTSEPPASSAQASPPPRCCPLKIATALPPPPCNAHQAKEHCTPPPDARSQANRQQTPKQASRQYKFPRQSSWQHSQTHRCRTTAGVVLISLLHLQQRAGCVPASGSLAIFVCTGALFASALTANSVTVQVYR